MRNEKYILILKICIEFHVDAKMHRVIASVCMLSTTSRAFLYHIFAIFYAF